MSIGKLITILSFEFNCNNILITLKNGPVPLYPTPELIAHGKNYK